MIRIHGQFQFIKTRPHVRDVEILARQDGIIDIRPSRLYPLLRLSPAVEEIAVRPVDEVPTIRILQTETSLAAIKDHVAGRIEQSIGDVSIVVVVEMTGIEDEFWIPRGSAEGEVAGPHVASFRGESQQPALPQLGAPFC